MARKWRKSGLALIMSALGVTAAWAQPVRVAYIEVLSGTLGAVGERAGKNLQFVVDELNAKAGPGGRKFEVVRFDSKGSPQEALASLKLAVDQGIELVMIVHESTPQALLENEAVCKEWLGV